MLGKIERLTNRMNEWRYQKPTCQIRLADLRDPQNQRGILQLLDHYSQHPMGNGTSLEASIIDSVMQGLMAHPTTAVFLAFGPEVTEYESPLGMAICFVGFSTFKARQLINVHDLIVRDQVRGQGIGGTLLDAVIEFAKQQRFCAVTLEVRRDNPARTLYARKGFQALEEPLSEDCMLFGKLQLAVS